MSRVLILRPEPDAQRTAYKAAQIGLNVALHPLFVPQALDWTPPRVRDFDALLLTSANAARFAGPALARYRTLPSFAVGQATAAALRDQGFFDVVIGDADGSAIAAVMAAQGYHAALHLAGTTVAPLVTNGLNIVRIAVYTMATLPDDGTLLRDATAGSILLVHSANAGKRLAERVPEPARGVLHVVAISAAAMAACGEGWASLSAPAQPRDDDMLALARSLCE